MNAIKDSIQQKIRYIANHYGFKSQSRMCIEECAELIQSINKFHRAKKGGNPLKMAKARKKMLGEMADVQVMVEQLKYLTVGEDEVLEIAEKKLDRQIKRINKKKARKSK